MLTALADWDWYQNIFFLLVPCTDSPISLCLNVNQSSAYLFPHVCYCISKQTKSAFYSFPFSPGRGGVRGWQGGQGMEGVWMASRRATKVELTKCWLIWLYNDVTIVSATLSKDKFVSQHNIDFCILLWWFFLGKNSEVLQMLTNASLNATSPPFSCQTIPTKSDKT